MRARAILVAAFAAVASLLVVGCGEGGADTAAPAGHSPPAQQQRASRAIENLLNRVSAANGGRRERERRNDAIRKLLAEARRSGVRVIRAGGGGGNVGRALRRLQAP